MYRWSLSKNTSSRPSCAMTEADTLVTLVPGGPEDTARQLVVGAHWGDDLTPPQYATREAHVLASSAFAQLVKVVGIALPEEPAVPAVSCEAYAMELLHVASPGVVARGQALGIASVFTLLHFRRRGLASRMLRALAASTHAAHAHALLLMSEVDPALYERCGYVAPNKVITDWVFSAATATAAAAAAATLVMPEQLAHLVARLNTLLERDLRAHGEVGAVAVLPTAEQFIWHSARYEGRCKALGLDAAPQACGATRGDAFAIWALDAEDGVTILRILALVASADANDTAAVLSAAVHMGASAGAPGGRTLAWTTGTLHTAAAAQPWTPPTEQLAHAGVSVASEARRCLSVPMMAPLRPHLQPASWAWIPRGVWV